MPAEITKHLRRHLSTLIVVVTLGALVYFIAAHREDFKVLYELDVVALLKIFAAVVLCWVVGGYQLKVFLGHHGVHLPCQRCFGLYVVMSMINIVTPVRGGTGIAAVYLKHHYGLAFRRFALVAVGTYVLAAAVNSVLALVGLAWSHVAYGVFSVPAAVGAGIILAVSVGFFFVPNLRESDRWGWNHVVQLVNGWHRLVKDRRLLVKLLSISCVQSFAQALAYLLTFDGLEMTLTWPAALTIVSMSIIASLVSLTPASLGPYDAALVAGPTIFGITISQAMAALLVFRGVSLVGATVLAGPFWFLIREPAGGKPSPDQSSSEPTPGPSADGDADG